MQKYVNDNNLSVLILKMLKLNYCLVILHRVRFMLLNILSSVFT